MDANYPASISGVWVEVTDVPSSVVEKCRTLTGCYHRTGSGLEFLKVSYFWAQQREIRIIDDEAIFG